MYSRMKGEERQQSPWRGEKTAIQQRQRKQPLTKGKDSHQPMTEKTATNQRQSSTRKAMTLRMDRYLASFFLLQRLSFYVPSMEVLDFFLIGCHLNRAEKQGISNKELFSIHTSGNLLKQPCYCPSRNCCLEKESEIKMKTLHPQ